VLKLLATKKGMLPPGGEAQSDIDAEGERVHRTNFDVP
jgi:hypothetical protein